MDFGHIVQTPVQFLSHSPAACCSYSYSPRSDLCPLSRPSLRRSRFTLRTMSLERSGGAGYGFEPQGVKPQRSDFLHEKYNPNPVIMVFVIQTGKRCCHSAELHCGDGETLVLFLQNTNENWIIFCSFSSCCFAFCL